MSGLDRIEHELGEASADVDMIVGRLGLSEEDAAKFRAEMAQKLQDAIAEGWERGKQKAEALHAWAQEHPDATEEEEREFRRTIDPEEVAWEEWTEANMMASRQRAAEAYEEIYGFEPDDDDLELFEGDDDE